MDPISLNQQTLELREHLHGPADIVLVAEEVRFAAHKSVLVAVRTIPSWLHTNSKSRLELTGNAVVFT